MESISVWIAKNKEWFFSGAGIAIIGLIGRFVFKGLRASSSQRIRSGNNSINIQAGRDAKFSSGSQRDDLEKK